MMKKKKSKVYEECQKKRTRTSRSIIIVLNMYILLSIFSPAGFAETTTSQKLIAQSEKILPFSYDNYAHVLKQYVNDQSLVNYKQLKINRQHLDTFVKTLRNVTPATFKTWDEKEKIAFWINAYNALTLVAIINHYPIKASILGSFRFPSKSIRQIPGVWKKLQFTVMGKKVTLDEIEHKILRAQFKEARIHMALVCASIGCPPLRNEPFTGPELEKQLDDQARKFLALDRNFRIDRQYKKVYLSSIFSWFKTDFVHRYSPGNLISGQNKAESAFLNFVAQYAVKEQKKFLLSDRYAIKYLDYDWSLNGD